MKNWIFKIIVCSVNVFLLDFILSGIEVKDIFTAVIVAVVLAVLDLFVKPLLILLTLPVTVFTLGLFLLVINASVIMIDAHYVAGFKVASFWDALIFSLLLSFFNGLVNGKIKASVHINKGKKD